MFPWTVDRDNIIWSHALPIPVNLPQRSEVTVPYLVYVFLPRRGECSVASPKKTTLTQRLQCVTVQLSCGQCPWGTCVTYYWLPVTLYLSLSYFIYGPADPKGQWGLECPPPSLPLTLAVHSDSLPAWSQCHLEGGGLRWPISLQKQHNLFFFTWWNLWATRANVFFAVPNMCGTKLPDVNHLVPKTTDPQSYLYLFALSCRHGVVRHT